MWLLVYLITTLLPYINIHARARGLAAELATAEVDVRRHGTFLMLVEGAGVCRVTWVGARLYVDICTIPAAVYTFGLCEDTLGAYHHQVADDCHV